MSEVVKNLHLYASFFEENKFAPKSAYTTSPVVVEAADLDNVTPVKKVTFQFSEKDSQVVIGSKRYPLNQFVNTEYGSLKFTPNGRQLNKAMQSFIFYAGKP